MLRSRLREAVSWSLVLVVLGLLCLYVWATYHPDHELIARAAGWPVVGPAVERFRVYYGVSGAEVAARRAAAESAGDEAGGDGPPIEVEWVFEAEEGGGGPMGAAGPIQPGDAGDPGDLGAGAAAGYSERHDRVWIAAGDAVRRQPDDDAPAVGRVDAFEQVVVVERRGDWARVESSVGLGWVEAPAATESYPLGSGVRPTLPLEGAVPAEEYVRAARELMGVEGPRGRLGPYALYTDVEPPVRLAHLDRLAAQVEPAYRSRYGVTPRDRPREAMLVFAEEGTYRVFQSREARLRGIPSGGHAGHGMLAFWVGDRQPHELEATLVHEVVHLLNRRALGPALPPWLDEGMADDLGSSKVGPEGDLQPGELGGLMVRGKGRIDYFGAVAGLRNLNASFARSDAPRVEELVGLEWEEFVAAPRRDLNYAHAGFFVRYLVDGEDGALRPGFHGFLRRVAAGGPVSGEALRDALGRSWEQLDRGLGDFVRALILETTPTSQEEREAEERERLLLPGEGL